jgi:hypothetical protein
MEKLSSGRRWRYNIHHDNWCKERVNQHGLQVRIAPKE